MTHYTFALSYEISDFFDSDEPTPVAKIRVIEDSTLFELADALLAAIDFDLDHAFGFHSDLRNPYAKNMEQEYTLFADQGEGRMPSDTGVERTYIHQVFQEGSKMLFHFDYGDDWHFLVQCPAIERTTNRKRKPEVVQISGNFPEQYPEEEDCSFQDPSVGLNPMTGERIEIHKRK